MAGCLYEFNLPQQWEIAKGIALNAQKGTRGPPTQSSSRPCLPEYNFFEDIGPKECVEIKIESVQWDGDFPQRLEDLRDNVLYYPEKSNNPAIDYLIKQKTIIYGLQATIQEGYEARVASNYTFSYSLNDLLRTYHLLESSEEKSKSNSKGVSKEYEYVHIFVMGGPEKFEELSVCVSCVC